MIPRLVQSRSGPPTVVEGDLYIHSQYDPINEAERFVRAVEFPENTEYIIIFEPGLGYCIPFLKERLPNTSLLVIHVSDFYASLSETYDREALGVWYPSDSLNLVKFLEREIPEGSVCRILEWRPSARAYGSLYKELLCQVKQFLEREAANRRTTVGFGRRWLKNFFRNLILLQKPLYFEAGSIPVVVTGAGPSLEDAIPLIIEAMEQGPLCIVAASSSVPALLAHGILPTLSVATDGGTWAAFHLIDQFRRAAHGAADLASPLPFPLAVALTAKNCSQAAQVPQLAISDGSLWQSRLLQKLKIPHLQLPQRGTVSATLIDIALLLTTGPVYITGMDMANRDLRTHTRPYGLDFYLDEKVTRFAPLYSLTFGRSRTEANSLALSIYAAWFDSYFSDNKDRITVLGESHPRFSMLAASRRIVWGAHREPSFYIIPNTGNGTMQERDYVSMFIDEFLHTSDQGKIQQELSYLLTGDKKALSVPEIEKSLAELFKMGA